MLPAGSLRPRSRCRRRAFFFVEGDGTERAGCLRRTGKVHDSGHSLARCSYCAAPLGYHQLRHSPPGVVSHRHDESALPDTGALAVRRQSTPVHAEDMAEEMSIDKRDDHLKEESEDSLGSTASPGGPEPPEHGPSHSNSNSNDPANMQENQQPKRKGGRKPVRMATHSLNPQCFFGLLGRCCRGGRETTARGELGNNLRAAMKQEEDIGRAVLT